ncbi:MAG: lipid-A-disaccharide synthase [Candidatus Binatia bacterium]
MGSRKRVLLVAGEASGDLHGAELARALLEKDSTLEISAVGGAALENAGARIVFDVDRIAGMGLTELAGHLTSIWRAYALVKRILREQRPSLLILIDFPDFNMRVARVAKRLRVPVLYYISPQVWAWRKGRIEQIARSVDRVAVVFPFEAPLYEKAGVKVDFVGHPLLDIARATQSREETLVRLGLNPSKRTIALLPGSRRREVAYHLPVMLEAAALLSRETPLQFVLVRASTVGRYALEPALARAAVAVSLSEGDAYNVLHASDLAWTASGTATLETALMLCPMIIVYRVTRLTYALARRLVRVEFIGMANIIAGEKIVPELIQGDMTAERIVLESQAILENRELRERMIAQLGEVRARLGAPGAAARTADIALGMIQ